MDRMRRSLRLPLRSAVLLLVLMSFASGGCGSKRNSVSGKVSYKGKNLSSGMVVFVDKDGKVSPPAPIAASGEYSASDVPLGVVTVCVDVLPPEVDDEAAEAEQSSARTKKGSSGQKANYIAIPPKYKDPKQSGVTFDVKPGANAFDIALP